MLKKAEATALPTVGGTIYSKMRDLALSLTKPLYWLYEERLYRLIQDDSPALQHLGLILDGNRRFARAMRMDKRLGHEQGVRKAHDVLRWCRELGIRHVTVFVLSTENLTRPPEEVDYLLDLFVKRGGEFSTPGVNVRVIGRREGLPERVLETVRYLESVQVEQPKLMLNIALAYGGREEIVDAMRSLLREAGGNGQTMEELAEKLTTKQIAGHLYTSGLPDPDFIIRTSGEQRLSGFCLWQAAYSEYYFCEAFWPAFRRVDFLRAIRNYQLRKRRFGR
jgi:short-chain Z-isoprenyl diphosphate synthase